MERFCVWQTSALRPLASSMTWWVSGFPSCLRPSDAPPCGWAPLCLLAIHQSTSGSSRLLAAVSRCAPRRCAFLLICLDTRETKRIWKLAFQRGSPVPHFARARTPSQPQDTGLETVGLQPHQGALLGQSVQAHVFAALRLENKHVHGRQISS